MRVYIAGPYTKPDPQQNTLNAIKAADEVLAKGHTPFLPHLFHYWEAVSPKPYQVWTAMDMEWLELCDAVLRLPGESPGTDAEVELANELGIPVYERVEDL